ncbi:ATP-binding protein [Mesonia sp. MT50]|uniref:histidine kinase n=1 Tax=Mesonia profundi TaxID=3070998 RepID=A0ABU0ZY27_9FLAO|nr:ATP-binding protein [Mesonia profundi]MDQ7916289.1 ATP-binding protein [Mesonia profundi]
MSNKLNVFFSWFINRPKITGFAVFFAVLLVFSFIIYQEYSLSQDQENEKEAEVLSFVEQNIEQSFKSGYMAALTLALTINDKGEPENFNKVAEKILSSSTTISSLQLVPNGIISHVYPYVPNRKALKLNILKDSKLNDEAKKAIIDKNMHFAGPINLIQGGEAVVGRLPIFIKNEFWGFSVVLINKKDFIENAGINKFSKKGFDFKLSKVYKNSSQEAFYYGQENAFDSSSSHKVYIEDGDWNIYIYSKNKDHLLLPLLSLTVAAFLFSIVIGWFTANFLKLQQKVDDQAVKLLNSEQRFKTIFNRAPIGIVHIAANNHKFITANEHFLNKLGYSLEEIHGITFDAICQQPEDLKTLLESGGKLETDFIKKGGDKNNMRMAITCLKHIDTPTYIFIIEDVTERNKTQSALKELKSRMEMAAHIAQLGYWEWNIDTNEILWTKTMYEIYRVANDTKLTGEFVLSKVHPSDVQRYISKLKTLLDGGSSSPYEAKILAPDGSLIFVMGHLENEINKEGRVIKLKGTLIDISGEKRIKEELNQSYDMVLKQNQRLINFSYIVSHNLRSHASNIQSLIYLLLDMDHAEEQKEMFGMLSSVSQALDDTLFDLNDVINIQNNTSIFIESILVRKYIQRVLEVLQVEISQKNVKILINVPAEIKISFNPAYFESILLNFISNAIRYKHPDRISTILIDYLVLKDRPVLKIKDNGIGIDLEKNGEKLFGMYKTFSKDTESRGLGLFISKGQMEALGGKITVQSELGKGSVFNLFF